MKQIDSIKNEHVKGWKKLHTKKGREKAGQFLIEGYHLVEEAIKAGITIDVLLVTKEGELPTSWQGIEVIIVSEAVLKELTETKTPQGIIAICRMKEEANELTMDEGVFLLVDRIQDPGNIGTIIRTADSAGADAVILGDGTVDIYNSKVIRATQGSLFHLPILKGSLHEWMIQLKRRNIPVYGTSLQNAKSYEQIEQKQSFALIVGNEGEGVNDKLLELTDDNLYIPIYGKAESLNVAVATGILLYSLRKK